MTPLAWRALVAAGLALLAPLGAAAADDAAERLRIARDRADAQQRYAAAERDCAERFAVTACLDTARRERREVLQRLRREETLLDEARRRQRAAERVDAIRNRISEEEQGRRTSPKAPRDDTPHAPRFRARERAEPASGPASGPAPLRRGRVTVREKAPASTSADRAAEEARSRAAYDARQRAAQAHEEANRQRNEQRAKDHKPASPLPVASGASR